MNEAGLSVTYWISLTIGAYHLNKPHAPKSSELLGAFPLSQRPPAVASSPDRKPLLDFQSSAIHWSLGGAEIEHVNIRMVQIAEDAGNG